MAPRSSTTHVFEYLVKNPGDQQFTVSIDEDDLSLDNQRFLTVHTRNRNPVLVVGDQHNTRYVRAALEAAHESDRIQIQWSRAPLWKNLDWFQFDCIILCNIGEFEAADVNRFADYLRTGGTAIVFLGDRTAGDAINRLAERFDASDFRVGPAIINRVRFTLESQHPILQSFRVHPEAGLQDSVTFSYYDLKVASKIPVVLTFDNGSAAITDHFLHFGRLFVVATAAADIALSDSGDVWTTWPVLPSFPPWLFASLSELLLEKTRRRNTVIGATVQGALNRDQLVGICTILRNDTSTETKVPVNQQTGSWSLENRLRSGHYTVKISEEVSAQQFSVNVDASESDLTSIDQATIPKEINIIDSVEDVPFRAISEEPPTYWSRYLLLAVVCLILVDATFGRAA